MIDYCLMPSDQLIEWVNDWLFNAQWAIDSVSEWLLFNAKWPIDRVSEWLLLNAKWAIDRVSEWLIVV